MNGLPSGVYFLSQILLAMWQSNSQASVEDVNGNFYTAYNLLFVIPNPTLLNAIFYWNADARTVTFCYSSPGLAQPYPINGWVNTAGGPVGQPGWQVPPPAPVFTAQPLSPPTTANQGTPGLSGALTPFGGVGQPPTNLEARALYRQRI